MNNTFVLEAKGKSGAELLVDAANRLWQEFIDPTEVGDSLREKIVLEAPDGAELLRGWVNALLKLAAEQRMILARISIEKLEWEGSPARVQATGIGELIDPLRHQLRRDVRAHHCSRAAWTQNNGVWTGRMEFSS